MPPRSLRLVTFINLILLIMFLCYFFFIRKDTIAYVDSAKLVNGYQGMIDARQVYQKKAAGWQANIDTLSKEVQQRITAYEKESLKMSRNERDLSRELIRTKEQQLQEYSEAMNAQAQQEDAKMTSDVISQMNAFIKKYGKANNYTIILAAVNGNVVYAEDAIDLTDEILDGLNKEYKGQ